MKKKNILYSVLNFILIIFALLYIIPMFQEINLSEDTLFGVYENLSIVMICIFFSTFFLINLVIGILNIRRKNNTIGVLSIVSGCIAIVNIILTIIYKENHEDVLAYIIFGTLACQIIISIFNLVLNRKKESSDLKKHSIIIFSIILLLGIVFVAFPRILLKINSDRIVEAYNILEKENRTQLLIDDKSNFYDFKGNLIAKNNYDIAKMNKKMANGTDIITVMDNNELWIINYKGEKLVRLYYIFTDSESLLENLIDYSYKLFHNTEKKFSEAMKKKEVNYLTTETVKDNYLKFTSNDKKITIEIEIDKTQIEKDTSLYKFISQYYMEYYDAMPSDVMGVKGIDLETFYKYKKNYYLTYENNERIQLECNNLLVDYNEYDDNYILYMYSNWNIPFYDEDTSGFIDLKGKKYTMNKQYLVLDTLDNYIILYNKVYENYYITTYGLNDPIKLERIVDYDENYVYAFKEVPQQILSNHILYLTNNDKIKSAVENIKYTINHYVVNIDYIYGYYGIY